MKPAGCCAEENAVTGRFAALGREHLFWFLLVGVISSLVDLGLLYYLCEYWGIWYIPAAVASYCCGILVSYSLNKYLTFRDRTRNNLLQFTTFAAISVSCLMVNICIIWLAVELASLNYLVAKMIAMVCAFFWNYYGQSRITFRGR
jgi:putative flippase GtrA